MRIIALLSVLLAFNSFSQQDFVSSMYSNPLEYYNPAATGIDYRHKAIAQYRKQWVDVNGAPTTLVATYGLRLDSINSGIGFAGSYDAIGFNRQTTAGINYSYHFKFRESVLGVGVTAGVLNFGLSPNWVPPVTLEDESLPKSRSVTTFDAKAGVYFRRKEFFAGAAISHFTAPTFKLSSGMSYNLVPHLSAVAGYLIPVSKNVAIEPSVFCMSELKEISATFTAKAILYRNIQLSVIYRTSDAVGFSASYDIIGKFRIGYCYDITLNILSGISRGSHEAVIGFLLK